MKRGSLMHHRSHAIEVSSPPRGHAVTVEGNGAWKIDILSVLRSERGQNMLDKIDRMKKDLSKAG